MPIIKCDECGSIFYKRPNRIKSSKNNFCSHKCAGKYTSKKNSQIKVCPFCKRQFRIKNSEIKRKKTLFCSRNCWLSYIKDNKKTSIGSDGYEHYDNKRKHRVIVEEFIGRKLTKDEVIHHKNGIRSDNRIENLIIMTKSEHHKLHYKEIKYKLSRRITREYKCVVCGKKYKSKSYKSKYCSQKCYRETRKEYFKKWEQKNRECHILAHEHKLHKKD